MRTRSRRRAFVLALVLAAVVAACGDAPGPTTSAPADSTPAPKIVVGPEFVNGAVPGSDLVLLVGLDGADGGEVTLTAEAPGAVVEVSPAAIAGDEVAEVVIVPDPVEVDTDIEVTVTATGEGGTDSVTRMVTVVPWEDDRGDQARAVLDLFLPWLAEQHPEFGLTTDTEFAGTMTAPLLLIVSHYGFYSEDWEVGVSWHIMVPPDDFAELYLRPRGEFAPTHAFRIESWQTALETGVVEVSEVEPPAEPVR
jgi:hypothetical protein